MKKLFVILILSFFSYASFASPSFPQSRDVVIDEQASDQYVQEEGEGFDDIDSMFEEAEDAEEPVVKEDASIVTTINGNNFAVPLRFTGSLNAAVGLAGIHDDEAEDKNAASAYMKFTNYLYFSAIADQTMAVHGSVKTALPSSTDDYIELNELYFTYLLLNRVYINAGKKGTSWGNIRLFSDTDNYDEEDEDATYTNVLTDSGSGVSGLVTVPYSRGSLNLFGLFKKNEGEEEVSMKNMGLAAAFDITLLQTNFNFFCRRFSRYDNKKALAGAEIKRTIFGFDIYGQSLWRIADKDKIGSIDCFEKGINTAGLYRDWDHVPRIGFIAEYQDVYRVEENDHSGRMALYAGISRIGKAGHGFGVNWRGNLYGNNPGDCELSVGHSLGGVLPHASWRNAFVWDYNTETKHNKYSFGTYLNVSMDY